MASITSCPRCGCGSPQGAVTHTIVAALANDDLDQAIELGLLDACACGDCDAACHAGLQQSREARLNALAARDRYRKRQARLQHRADTQQARRATTTPVAANPSPALPSAAAAALARAKARAAGSRKE